MKKLLKNSTFFIFLVLIAMCVFTAIAEPAFLKISNILSTARAFSSIAIAGIGVLMVILTGGIAYDKNVVGYIKDMIEPMAKVWVKPGENELEALAMNAQRVLEGKLSPKEYK